MESNYRYGKPSEKCSDQKNRGSHVTADGSLMQNEALIFFKSNELICHAHKLLEKSHLKICNATEKQNKQLCELRKRLYHAISVFDEVSIKMLCSSGDKQYHNEIIAHSRALILVLSEMRMFLKNCEKRPSKVLNGNGKSLNEEGNQKNIHLPIEASIHSFLNGQKDVIVNCTIEKNYYGFERQMNIITEFYEAIDCTLREMKKTTITFNSSIEDEFQAALKSTRHFARETRTISLQRQLTSADKQAVSILSNNWLDIQKKFIIELWEGLLPWSEILVDAIHSIDKTIEANMIRFRSINRGMLSMLDDMKSCHNLDFQSDDLNCFSSDLQKSAWKILSYVKLLLIDKSKKDGNWFGFNVWLLKWVFVIKQTFNVLDKCFHVEFDDLIKDEYLNGWKSICVKLLSCKESMASSQYEKVSFLYEVFIDHWERFSLKADFSNIEKIMMIGEWKINFLRICDECDRITSEISKPITSVIAAIERSDDYHTLLVFSNKVERICTHACLSIATSSSPQSQIHEVISCSNQLRDVTKQLISLCRRGQEMKDTILFRLLKYKWLIQMHYLLFYLRKIPDAKISAITAIMRHVYTAKDVSTPYEFIDVLNEKHEVDVDIGGRSSILDSDYLFTYDDCSYSVDSSHVNSFFSSEFDFEEKHDNEINQKKVKDVETNTSQKTLSTMQQGREENDFVSKNNEDDIDLPLPPLWITSDHTESDDTGTTPTVDSSATKAISAAARLMLSEANEWDETNNEVITTVKSMAKQMFHMSEFTNQNKMSKQDFVDIAKQISSNANSIVTFAKSICQYTNDPSSRADLLHHSELLQSVSTQLRIVASVKSFNVTDDTTKAMLIANANNIMKAVVGTLKAAEVASLNVGDVNEDGSFARSNHQQMLLQWKRKTRLSRAASVLTSPRDDLGLRKSVEPPALDGFLQNLQ